MAKRVQTCGDELGKSVGVVKGEAVLTREWRVSHQGEGLAGSAEWGLVAGPGPDDLDTVWGTALVALSEHEIEPCEVRLSYARERQFAVEPRDVGQSLR